MGTLDLSDLPQRPLLLLDSPPIIYLLEGNPDFGPRFRPLIDAHGRGELRLAVSTLALAEVMIGSLRAGDEEIAGRHRVVLESWKLVELTVDIAESAARLRASLGLKLTDAVLAASALAINADALVTYDRDFSRLKSLRVIS